MPKQALYLKWRPHAFDDVIGQDHITRTLLNSIQTGRIRHAYLFSGPRGTGKTTTARLLANALGAGNMDLIEIDAASHTGVDDVRDLRDKIAFMPTGGQYKVYIIDEVHRFSGSAFDALLKTLEEPPEHAIFVLATTEIDKVPDTIKSRCLQFEFRRVSLMEVADRLQLIAESEGLNIDRAALELIARQGTGSVRDSISLLDQIVADPDEHITLELAQKILGTASSSSVLELADAIARGDVLTALHVINHAIDSGSDPRQFGQQIVEHLRNVLLAQTSSVDLIEASDEMRSLFANQAQQISRGVLLRAVRVFNDAVNDNRGGWKPQLSLELALLETLQDAPQQPAPVMTQSAAAPAAPTSFDPTMLLFDLERRMEQMVESRLANMPVADTANSAPQPQKSQPNQAPKQASQPEKVDSGAPPLVPLSQLKARWEETKTAVKHVKKGKLFAPLLEHADVVDISGAMVTIGAKNNFFMNKIDQPEYISILSWVLAKLHDVEQLKVRVICVDENMTTQQQVDNASSWLVQAASEMGGELRKYDDKTD